MNPDIDTPPAQWAVLIEEMVRRNAIWHVASVEAAGFDLDEARAAALRTAVSHRPPFGGAKFGREVFQQGPDVLIVSYGTMYTGTLYFKVSVVRHVASVR